jgi:YHS domain-containing protein
MSNPTVNGVYYDVKNSPITVDYKGYRYHFSSVTHADKFRTKVKIREEWLTHSFTRRFHFTVDASTISVLQLYMQVETRGFFIQELGGSFQEFKSPDDIRIITTHYFLNVEDDEQCLDYSGEQKHSLEESEKKLEFSTETLIG